MAVIVAAGVLGAAALSIVSPLALVWLPIVALPAAWAFLRVSRTEYVITSRRIAIRRGVLGVSVDVVGLERVQNTTVTQHPIGRAIGYGTVAIEAASGATFAFRTVEKPTAVRERLESRRARTRPDEAPGTVAEWEAILDEVRRWRRAVERPA
ncbi:PH domain-containing protein [Natrarchaeobius oligotrophus]|uniref:PH domain-containing protein n=1 Tax=Natrarchaeobius chitinivorans TaxID=1679083 RepID=A0A3N6PM44_NATCH|nr:PH domain-containing protein [Natrarchaeobius chitinivorans]